MWIGDSTRQTSAMVAISPPTVMAPASTCSTPKPMVASPAAIITAWARVWNRKVIWLVFRWLRLADADSSR